jgi:hypothetical protein
MKANAQDLLWSFRQYYNLTQISVARWLLLPAGTYRDYEQARSEPIPIVRRGIEARIPGRHRTKCQSDGGLCGIAVKLFTSAEPVH